MKRQPWNLLSSGWGEIWGRGWTHGTDRKQFTVDVVIKITIMSFIVWIERLSGEKWREGGGRLRLSLFHSLIILEIHFPKTNCQRYDSTDLMFLSIFRKSIMILFPFIPDKYRQKNDCINFSLFLGTPKSFQSNE